MTEQEQSTLLLLHPDVYATGYSFGTLCVPNIKSIVQDRLPWHISFIGFRDKYDDSRKALLLAPSLWVNIMHRFVTEVRYCMTRSLGKAKLKVMQRVLVDKES